MLIKQKILVVAALWADSQGRYFVAQRSPGQALAGLWEFPGGKVEAGEPEKRALARELKEELDIQASIGEFFMQVEHEYAPDKVVLLRSYFLTKVVGQPLAKEHTALKWVYPKELLKLALSPADIPIAKALINFKPVK